MQAAVAAVFLLEIPGMRDLRDDGSIPWSGNRSVGERPGFVVDQEEIITGPVNVVEPEIHGREPGQAVVLHCCGRQPAIVEGVIDLAVDQMSCKLPFRQGNLAQLVRRTN